MNIIVCVKSVPNSEQYDKIKLDPVRKTVIRDGIDAVVNPADLHAIELAVQLKQAHGAKVTLLSMGPPSAAAQLRNALAYGCDEAYLVSDHKFGGADSLATAYTLTKAVEKIGVPELVLLGSVSEDGATAHVPSQLGELLGLPHVTDVTAFELVDGDAAQVEKPTEEGVAAFTVGLPAVFGVDRRLNKVRHPNVMGIFGAKSKPLTTLTAEDFDNLDEGRIGLSGSPTQPGEYRDVSYGRTCAELKDAGQILRIIQEARR